MQQLLNRLRNKHFLALAGNGIISLVSVLTMALLYRSLSKPDVGTWFFFLSVYGMGEALRHGFLGTATVKFYAGTEPQRASTVLGSVWLLAIAIVGTLVLLDISAIFFESAITNTQVLVTIKWFGITFLSSLPFTLTFWILVANVDYSKILWLRMINSLSMILAILLLIHFKKMTLDTLLWTNFLTNCLTSFVCFACGYTRFKTVFKASRDCVTELFHFGKFSFATNVSSQLLSSTDTLIINFVLGPAAVAIYALPMRLMEIVEIPLRSFVGTGMSSMAAAFNNKKMEEVAFIIRKYAGMLTFGFIPLVMLAIIFADVPIALLGGNKYSGTEAANIYRIFMAFALLYPIDRFNGVALDIIHLPRINFYKVLIMLAFNVAGDFVGIHLFKNMYGVAWANFLTITAGLLFGAFQLRKHLSYSIGDILATGLAETRYLIKKTLSRKG